MPQLLGLVGPTASGKSEAALALSGRLETEIVSVDSMLVYRGMDIGTAKPTRAQRVAVAHHLIDVAEPSEPFSVARYQELGREVLREIAARGGRALLVGGSGLYFRALVDDLEFPRTDAPTRRQLDREAEAVGAEAMHRRLVLTDPLAAAKIEPGNLRRTVRALEVAAATGREFSSYAAAWNDYPVGAARAVGIEIDRGALGERVELRVSRMLDGGLLEEVRGLLARGLGTWFTSSQAIGYAEMARHLQGELSLDEAVAGTVRRTRNLARRQLAWFRRDPRIRWVRAGRGGATDVLDELGAELETG